MAHHIHQFFVNELPLVCTGVGVLNEGWVLLAGKVVAILVHAFPGQQPWRGQVGSWEMVFEVGICQMLPIVGVVGLAPILMHGGLRLYRQ